MKPTFDLTDKVPLKKMSVLLSLPGNSQVFYSNDISNIKPLSRENRFQRRIRTEIERSHVGKFSLLTAPTSDTNIRNSKTQEQCF